MTERHARWGDYTTRGNGERVVDAHAPDLRHAPAAGWFVYDGNRWAEDLEEKAATQRAMEVLTSMDLDAHCRAGMDLDDLRHCRSSQSPAAYSNALKVAALYPPIATTFDHFDDASRAPAGHEFRLNVLNGTIDLRTKKIEPHQREDMITKLAPIRFDESADPAQWISFLEAAQPDAEVRNFLQRLAGYWLSGAVRDEVFPIFWGEGGNGKGTYLDTIRKMMGDYSGPVPEQVLIAQKIKPHPTALMIFRGLRLAVASETDDGDTIAIATLKRLTGGDVITARFLNKDFVSFEPTHKLVLMTNPRPKLQGNITASLRRRIFFIPWNTIFEGARMDTGLKPKLAKPEGLSAALNWCLEGYQEWARIGLAPPRSVLSATEDYMASEDTIGEFVLERCELDPAESVSADDLYKAYRVYCKERGEQSVIRSQDFKGAFLGKRGPKEAGVTWKRTETARLYRGVRLRPKGAEDYAERDGAGRRPFGRWTDDA